MATFFVFSDESGQYKQSRTPKFIKSHPLYVRSTLIMDSSEWKTLSERFFELKRIKSLPIEKEIKWEYLWEIWEYECRGKKIQKDCMFLESFKYKELEDFVEKSLSLLDNMQYKSIIITLTSNALDITFQEKEILQMHLQDIMERIELEFTTSKDNLAVIFIDHISEELDRNLREIYSEFFRNDDFIKKYSHIKDSLNIEYSHHSVGIQLADFIAGCSHAFIRSILTNKNFEFSKKLFKLHVFPYLRKQPGKGVFGYGIKEVPGNETFRNELKEKINF